MVPGCPLSLSLAQSRRNTRAARVEERGWCYKEWGLLQWGMGRKYWGQRAHQVIRIRLRSSKPCEEWTRVWGQWVCWPFQQCGICRYSAFLPRDSRQRYSTTAALAELPWYCTPATVGLFVFPALTYSTGWCVSLGLAFWPCLLHLSIAAIFYDRYIYFFTRLYLWIILNEEQMCSNSTARYNFLEV